MLQNLKLTKKYCLSEKYVNGFLKYYFLKIIFSYYKNKKIKKTNCYYFEKNVGNT